MEMGHQAYDHAEKVDEPSSTLVGLSLPQREIDIEHGKEFSFDNKEWLHVLLNVKMTKVMLILVASHLVCRSFKALNIL